MDRLETLVQDVLAEHAHDAPSADGLLAAVTAHPSRQRAYTALAAAAVVLLVVGLILAVRAATTSHSDSRPAGPPTGYRWQSYRGVTVAVPARLPTVTGGCGYPRNVVLAFAGLVDPLCPGKPRPTPPGTAVAMSPGSYADALSVTPRHVRIDGHQALRGYGRGIRGLFDSAQVGVLAIPDLHLVIVAASPDRTVVDTVLGSVRVTPVDRFGCPASPPAIAPVQQSFRTLVPNGAVSVVRCTYSRYGTATTYGLDDSARLAPGKVAALVRLIDGLPRRAGAARHPAYVDWVVIGYADGSHRTLTYAKDSRYLTSGGDVDVVSDGRVHAVDRGERIAAALR